MTESTLASWLDEEGTLSHNYLGCDHINCTEHEADLGLLAYTVLLQTTTHPPYCDGLASLPAAFDRVSYSDAANQRDRHPRFAPVFGASTTPEPSTSALMLVGFPALGFAGYRRARSAVAAG